MTGKLRRSAPRMRRGDQLCPADCPTRAVGCRKTCKAWAEHERRKAERYKADEERRASWLAPANKALE